MILAAWSAKFKVLRDLHHEEIFYETGSDKTSAGNLVSLLLITRFQRGFDEFL